MQLSDLDMEQGATFRVTLTYEDSDTNPISLVGYRAHMQVRTRFGSAVLIDLSSDAGDITLGGVTGVIEVRAKASATALVKRNAVYDLHLIATDDPDEVVRVFGGAINLTKAVTVA